MNEQTNDTSEAEASASPNDFATALAAKEAARLASRPSIDDLPDALARDPMGRLVLLARPGEKLIVERYATILPSNPWLDTKTYTVQSIDEATGRVHLWDDELQRVALTDYVLGTKAGYRFKLPVKGRPVVASKRKRGRPRKAPPPLPTAAAAASTPTSEAAPTEKRGRGRPKGVKNRPKAEIAAEKKAKAADKAAAKAVRAAKATAKRPKATAASSSKAKPAAAPASRKGPGAAPARRASAKR